MDGLVEPSKAPSKLFFQGDTTRRLILGSYWAVIILALPIWWHTTSIQRLSLPTQRVLAQETNTLRFPIHLSVLDPATAADVRERATQWEALDVVVDGLPVNDSPGSYTVLSTSGHSRVHGRTLHLQHGAPAGDVLSALLAPNTQSSRVVQYAPRYRLAFTLLNEEATALSWNISQAISQHLSPMLNRVSVLHQFTIESQVQFHAPLAFTPGPDGLTAEDLTVFVNSAEWTLSSSVSNDPVIHLILFVPKSPLKVIDAPETNAFLLPQWGGIVLVNPSSKPTHLSSEDLTAPFASFRDQIMALLGVPALPIGVSTDAVVSDWQRDALMRRRALENAQASKETLRSIVKLVKQIENMPVGQDVKGDVLHALWSLDKVYQSNHTMENLVRSADALTFSSRAFFNPGMLALLYFPAEHKYAIYLPMFASALLPLFSALLREVSTWKKRKAGATKIKVT